MTMKGMEGERDNGRKGEKDGAVRKNGRRAEREAWEDMGKETIWVMDGWNKEGGGKEEKEEEDNGDEENDDTNKEEE